MKTNKQLRIETIIYTMAALTAITFIPAILQNAKFVDGTFPDALVEACEVPLEKQASTGTAVTAERKLDKTGKTIWVINDVTGRADMVKPNIIPAYHPSQEELEDQAIKEALNNH